MTDRIDSPNESIGRFDHYTRSDVEMLGQKTNSQKQSSDELSVNDLRMIIRQEIEHMVEDAAQTEIETTQQAYAKPGQDTKTDVISSLMQVPFCVASGLLYAVGGLVDSVGSAVGDSTKRR